MTTKQTGTECHGKAIKVFVIIGAGGSGKSSIIRALTGVGNISRQPGGHSRSWRVAYHQCGIQPTFVQGASLQEVRVSAEQFVQDVLDSRSQIAIVALQPQRADKFLSFFHSWGWVLSGVATVGDVDQWQSIASFGIVPLSLQPQSNAAANEQAVILRQAWGIL